MKYEKGFFVFKKKDMVVIKAEYVELRYYCFSIIDIFYRMIDNKKNPKIIWKALLVHICSTKFI